ncbi:hypothetical protein Leryth_024318, partial [Lithospermum erythrorhizon]
RISYILRIRYYSDNTDNHKQIHTQNNSIRYNYVAHRTYKFKAFAIKCKRFRYIEEEMLIIDHCVYTYFHYQISISINGAQNL